MPIPMAVTHLNKRYLNPLVLRIAGRGPLVDLEHVGRSTGRILHTPLMAYRHGDTVTVALTYGPDVQWLKNITAAGNCRMRLDGRWVDLGAPRRLDQAEGLARMPDPQRRLLRQVIRCRDFIELPVLPSQAQA